MKKKLFISVLLGVTGLTGCSEQKKADTPPEPAWITTVSPSGRKAECLWTGRYGGVAATTYQAELWCWEVVND